MRKFIITFLFAFIVLTASAQTPLKRVYNEAIDPMAQIDSALVQAKSEGKFVVCQVGGNWCPWCLRFADFITKDKEIADTIQTNFVYIHVNYNPRSNSNKDAAALLKRLGHPARFGFPVFVVLNAEGKVLHIQDSSFLEEGEGYDRDKVLRFFRCWTPLAVGE